MKPSAALTNGEAFLSLLRRLEPGGEAVHDLTRDAGLVGGQFVPQREDPGRYTLYVVADGPPAARGDNGKRWLDGHAAVLRSVLRSKNTGLCTIVFPGTWPTNQVRTRVGPTPVRLISAVHHLWADRLRLHDNEGNIDNGRRKQLLERLAGRWIPREEKQYTPPALDPVDETSASALDVRKRLLDSRPDFPSGGVTVIYGPGGIGKTFFLRRVASRISNEALADATVGIPVFAALPLLLHEDALETWISRNGLRLPIADIEALVSAGVIVPILDALDELVRGQAREGSKQFLQHLRDVASSDGRIVLSSRDYYLNLDPLVRDELASAQTCELKMGYFSRTGRRRYVQVRTGLDEKDAARWAGRLETQAQETLGGVAQVDMESLIGHPLFLDAFCQIIEGIPEDRRAVEAENFRVTSPDVFGEIVDKVLSREHDKAKPGWDVKFRGAFAAPWDDPFVPELQLRVFTHFVLRAAADGGAEVVRREADDARYRQLRHAVFTFTANVSEDESPHEVLEDSVASILGPPVPLAPRNPEDDAKLIAEALDEYRGFLAQHTLADTRPNLPPDLVFATRHRAYFDYLLAQELLERLHQTFARPDAATREEFVEWCLQHHIFERLDGAEAPFATCLDFALWHRTALREARGTLDRLFDKSNPAEEVLASYVISLALAVSMRAGALAGGTNIEGLALDPADDFELALIETVVPTISTVSIENCSMPTLSLRGVTIRNSRMVDCDVAHLDLGDSTLIDVTLENTICRSVHFSGTVRITNALLDLAELNEGAVEAGVDTTIVLRNCRLSSPLFRALSRLAADRRDLVKLSGCQEIELADVVPLSAGRLFVNRLTSLARKHGHNEYGVYGPKLRGLTAATGTTFPKAVQVLHRLGIVTHIGEMLVLTPRAEKHLYSGKGKEGHRQYAEVAEFWDPVVAALDEVFES